MNKIYEELGISPSVYSFGENILKSLKERFELIDQNAEYNQAKVLKAMQENKVSAECFNGSTGYGYDDIGRDTLEKVYASVFKAESALVRPQITCGTHALALALMSNLRPGDELLSPVGKPYDTLEEVIGIRPSNGSLAEYGITYSQVDLLEDGSFDFDGIKNAINEKTKLVTIQRSKGYATRPTLSVERIQELISFIKNIKPDIICMVDNCYGEFVERIEPIEVGADMCVGSLIKNPGGGLAPIGGYIVGKNECIENAAHRLTSPGLGKEVGASLGIMQSYVSKIIHQDERYAEEKKDRTMKSILKKKEYNKIYNKAHPKQKDNTDKEDYERLQAQLENDIKELSTHYNDISDLALAKWIPSAYHSNKSGNLLLDKTLRGSNDLPKIIRRDAKIGVQKFKNKYVYSY